jgi:hypothetical protein
MLMAEYNGQMGTGLGKGPEYAKKKAACQALATRLAGMIASTAAAIDADSGPEDDSPQRAIAALGRWKKF